MFIKHEPELPYRLIRGYRHGNLIAVQRNVRGHKKRRGRSARRGEVRCHIRGASSAVLELTPPIAPE
jgi:hypothetical protein